MVKQKTKSTSIKCCGCKDGTLRITANGGLFCKVCHYFVAKEEIETWKTHSDKDKENWMKLHFSSKSKRYDFKKIPKY